MKINVLGGSGSGTTTFSLALAEALDVPALDSDAYYWEPSEPPFQVKVPLAARHARLRHDFEASEDLVLCGSMMGSWGDDWPFDLVVFLRLPPELRMARLHARERQRYGERLDSDPIVAATSADFLAWAKRYDDPDFEGKSIALHEGWLAGLDTPVIRIEGSTTTRERVDRVLSHPALAPVTAARRATTTPSC